MRIALLGGRFDPVHNGHIAIVREVLKHKIAEQVWLLPDFQHQWNPIIASPEDRIVMLNMATKGVNKLKIDTTSIEIGGSTETITVLHKLKQNYSYSFVFIGGSDQLLTLHKWTHWKELQTELPFIIIIRKGYPIKHYYNNVTILEDSDYQPLDDSSTQIRTLLKSGKSIHGLVCAEVEQYIAAKGLYR